MSALFGVVDLDDGWTRGAPEPGGDERKRWFHGPDSSPHAGHWLFKPRTEKQLRLSAARQARGDSPDVLISGEDWAEKISYELAVLLRLPAARTELATVVTPEKDRVWGSMSLDMRPKAGPTSAHSQRWPWSAGASLLAEVDPSFDAGTCVGHTLVAVRDILTRAEVGGPFGTEYAEWAAFDVWVGYLVLDAWIANTDRHAHNWGVVQDPTSGATYLGPTYDHGTALASGETEDRRADQVARRSVATWCGRGRTFRFDGAEPRELVGLAVEALSLCSPGARTHWVSQITAVDLATCDAVVDRIPTLSDQTRTFVQILLETNRKRLRDAFH